MSVKCTQLFPFIFIQKISNYTGKHIFTILVVSDLVSPAKLAYVSMLIVSLECLQTILNFDLDSQGSGNFEDLRERIQGKDVNLIFINKKFIVYVLKLWLSVFSLYRLVANLLPF